MASTCLITGGAGFIGCGVSSLVAQAFDRVVAMDSLHPQVHAEPVRPGALDQRVELVLADVTRAESWDTLLHAVTPDVVLHLAAETGTAQSLTEGTRHANVNVVGTTQLLDALSRHGIRPERIVLTSSRAVYGEGAWRDDQGRLLHPGQRSHAMLERGEWDFAGLTPVVSDASRVEPRPSSVYAATKLAQEHLVRTWGQARGVAAVVLRLQNVYGVGQSLTNPYTGILPLFAKLARSGEAIPLYEDGDIVRDFVHVTDVARALLLAASPAGSDPDALPGAIDIGSGVPTTITEVARLVAAGYDAPAPVVTGRFRDGDVRYACADVSAAAQLLGWHPEVPLAAGVAELCAWVDQASDRR